MTKILVYNWLKLWLKNRKWNCDEITVRKLWYNMMKESWPKEGKIVVKKSWWKEEKMLVKLHGDRLSWKNLGEKNDRRWNCGEISVGNYSSKWLKEKKIMVKFHGDKLSWKNWGY